MPNPKEESPITGNEPAINPDHLKMPLIHPSVAALIQEQIGVAQDYSPHNSPIRKTAMYNLLDLAQHKRELDQFIVNTLVDLSGKEPEPSLAFTYIEMIASHLKSVAFRKPKKFFSYSFDPADQEITHNEVIRGCTPKTGQEVDTDFDKIELESKDLIWYNLFKNVVVRFRPIEVLMYLASYEGNLHTPRYQEVIQRIYEHHQETIIDYCNRERSSWPYNRRPEMLVDQFEVLVNKGFTQFIDVLAQITEKATDNKLRMKAAMIILDSGITD